MAKNVVVSYTVKDKNGFLVDHNKTFSHFTKAVKFVRANSSKEAADRFYGKPVFHSK